MQKLMLKRTVRIIGLQFSENWKMIGLYPSAVFFRTSGWLAHKIQLIFSLAGFAREMEYLADQIKNFA